VQTGPSVQVLQFKIIEHTVQEVFPN